jgi:VIT1/CCC1 family predicted Fe2+/Mn2+ transporter
MVKHSLKTGICFGITSGIITTLGLMVGLESGTHSKIVVLGGITTIAIADSFSDALGIHISEESETKHSFKEIWESTFSTLISKFLFASTFILPVLLLDLKTAINVSIIWGLSILSILSYYISKKDNPRPWKVVGEHLFIAIIVIVLANLVGTWVTKTF